MTYKVSVQQRVAVSLQEVEQLKTREFCTCCVSGSKKQPSGLLT